MNQTYGGQNMYGNDMYQCGGQLTDACPAEQASDVAQRLGYLVGSQGDTLGAITRLEERLASVLRPVPPTDGASKCGEIGIATSPLCEQLDRNIAHESAMYRRICAITDRLTV